MLVPLQSRPDLTLIVLAGLIVVIVFLTKMAQEVQQQSRSPTPQGRRNFLESLLAVIVTVVLLAYTLPNAISTFEEDDSESRILTIESGETYTVSSGENETWVAVHDNGVLNLNGSMDLEGSI